MELLLNHVSLFHVTYKENSAAEKTKGILKHYVTMKILSF